MKFTSFKIFWLFVVSTIFLFSTALLPAALAQQKPVLTIYTYDAFAADWGPGPKVKLEFEKTCNCTLKFVSTGSSIGALRKVQLEGNTTSADIVLGLDTNIAEAARNTGLFADHGITVPKLVIPATNDMNAADGWNDAQFLPFDYAYFAFVYNRKNTPAPPASFEQLAAQPDDFKIIIQDPRASTPGLGLLLWIKAVYGEKSAEIWQSLAPKILTVTKSWSEAYGLFLKGEADMVLSYTTSPAYHLIAEDDDSYGAAVFEGGNYLQIEVAGILKSSKNQALARTFMRFMLGEKFQNIIPTTNWTFPVINIGDGLPEAFVTLPKPATSLLIDGTRVEENRKQWIAEWLAAMAKK